MPTERRGKLFTMRWREDEAARAEAVAQHYGMPVAALVRMLIEREAKGIGAAADTSDPFKTKSAKRWAALLMLLRAVNDLAPADEGEILIWISGRGATMPDDFPAMLGALRRSGFMTKDGEGYTLTDKGDAFVRENEGAPWPDAATKKPKS